MASYCFYCTKQILDDLLTILRNRADELFTDLIPNVGRVGRSEFEVLAEVKASLAVREMGNANETQEAEFVKTVSQVHSHEEVRFKSCHTFVDLYIEPDQVVSRKEHETVELFV